MRLLQPRTEIVLRTSTEIDRYMTVTRPLHPDKPKHWIFLCFGEVLKVLIVNPAPLSSPSNTRLSINPIWTAQGGAHQHSHELMTDVREDLLGRGEERKGRAFGKSSSRRSEKKTVVLLPVFE